MPKYKCHGVVHAFEIERIITATDEHDERDPDWTVVLAGADDVKTTVSSGWMDRNQPSVGGYCVFHVDGQEGGNVSYMPAEVFEHNHSLLVVYEVDEEPSL